MNLELFGKGIRLTQRAPPLIHVLLFHGNIFWQGAWPCQVMVKPRKLQYANNIHIGNTATVLFIE